MESQVNIGEHVVFNLAENRTRDVFFCEDCRNVSFENISFTRFGGMGIVAQRCEDITLRNVVSLPAAGERISLTADNVQLINCGGNVLMEKCRMGWALDDPLNIHGNYLEVESLEGRKLKLRSKHAQHAGFFPYRPGDRLEFLEMHSRRLLAAAKVVKWTPDAVDHARCTLEVDAEISGVNHGVIVENVTLNPDVTIRDCEFTGFFHLRLSGRGDYLIENNRFTDGYASVLGMDLADYWYESGRIGKMVIRNNTVTHRGWFNFGISGWNGNEPDLPKVHGSIHLENNRFIDFPGQKWSAVGVRDFSVK